MSELPIMPKGSSQLELPKMPVMPKKKEDMALSGGTGSLASRDKTPIKVNLPKAEDGDDDLWSQFKGYASAAKTAVFENMRTLPINTLAGGLSFATNLLTGVVKGVIAKEDLEKDSYLKDIIDTIEKPSVELSKRVETINKYAKSEIDKSKINSGIKQEYLDAPISDVMAKDLGQGFKKLGIAVAENIPQVIALAATGGGSKVGSFLAGSAMATAQEMQAEFEKDKDISGIDVAQSAVKGAVEGLTESIFNTDLTALRSAGKSVLSKLADEPIKQSIKQSIKESGKEATKEAITRSYADVLKSTLKGMGEEAIEEVVATGASFMVDSIEKDRIDKKEYDQLMSNLLDAAMIGGAIGGNISALASVISRTPLDEEQKRNIQRYKEISDNQDLSEEVRSAAKKKIDDIVKFSQDKTDSNYNMIAALPLQDRVRVFELSSKVDLLEKDKRAIRDEALLEETNKIIASYESQIDDIIDTDQKAKIEEKRKAQAPQPEIDNEAVLGFFNQPNQQGVSIAQIDDSIDPLRNRINANEEIEQSEINDAIEKTSDIIQQIESSDLTFEQKRIASEPFYNQLGRLETYGKTIKLEERVEPITEVTRTTKEVGRVERPKTEISLRRFDMEPVEVTTKDGETSSYVAKIDEEGGISLVPKVKFRRTAQQDGRKPIKIDSNLLQFQESVKDENDRVVGAKLLDRKTGNIVEVSNPDLAVDLATRAKQEALGNVSEGIMEQEVAERQVGEMKSVVKEFVNKVAPAPVATEAAPEQVTAPVEEPVVTQRLPLGAVVVDNNLRNKNEGLTRKLSRGQRVKLEKANQALQSTIPGARIILYDNERDMANGIASEGYGRANAESAARTSMGVFAGKKNTVHINIDRMDKETVAHEIFHAVVKDLAKNNPEEFATMRDSINRYLSQQNQNKLKQFAEQYSQEEQAEEYLSQLAGLMSSGQVSLNKSVLDNIAMQLKNFVKKIADKIGSKELSDFADSMFKDITSRQQLADFFEGFADSVNRGRQIELSAINEIMQKAKTQRTKQEVTPSVVIKAQRADVTKTPVAGNRLFNEPLEDAKRIAEAYMKKRGLEYKEGAKIFSVDKGRAKRISDAYIAMEDAPTNPEVRKAYDAMIAETIEQYKEIVSNGYVVEINNKEPYKNAQEFIDDLRNNKRFKLLSTRAEFGDTPITEEQMRTNPLLMETEFKATNGEKLLANDVFRFVHDFFGHSVRGNSLGAVGEENAWDEHSRMYTPLARRAMTSETRGQNSYVNFSGVNDEAFRLRDVARRLRSEGKVDEANKIVDKVYEMMSFAPQKIGLLPEEFSLRDDEIQPKKETSPDKLKQQKQTPVATEDGTTGTINIPQSGKNVVNYNDTLKRSIDGFEFKRFDGMGKNLITNVKLSDLGNVFAHLTFADRLTAGSVNGQEYFGGPLFAEATGNFWAAQRIDKANFVVKSVKTNPDGYKYLAPALLSETAHLSNSDMLSATIKLVESKINSGAIGLNEANTRILKALSLTKTKGYKSIYEDSVSGGITKESINRGIENALFGTNSTFETRKAFLESILGNANIKKEKRFGGIPSLSEIAGIYADPVTSGLDFGYVPLMIRTKGELSIVEPKKGDKDYHPSYKYVIKSSEPVETVLFDQAYDATEMFPEVENSKGEKLGIKEYEKIYGSAARTKYLMFLGAGPFSRPVSRDIVSDIAGKKDVLRQQKMFSTLSEIRRENEEKFNPKLTPKQIYRTFRKWFDDRMINARKALENSGMNLTMHLMYNRAGASIFGNLKFNQLHNQIFGNLTDNEKTLLNDIIFYRRIIAIDENFDNRGVKRPLHPKVLDFNGNPVTPNKEIAERILEDYMLENGSEMYDKVDERADKYFQAYSDILKYKYENGLIDKETYELYRNYNYMPRRYLNKMFGTKFEEMELNINDFQSRSIFMSKEELRRISEGSEDAITIDAARLLQMDMIATEVRVATNKALKSLFNEGISQNAEFVREVQYERDSAGNIKYEKDGSPMYNTRADQGFTILRFKEDGVTQPFQVENQIAKEFLDLVKLDTSSPVYKFFQKYSGAGIVRALATGINPAFVMSNIPLDITSQVQMNDLYSNGERSIPSQYAKALKDTIVNGGKFLKSKNKLEGTEIGDLLYEYGQAGGLMTTLSEEYSITSKNKYISRASDFLSSFGNASEIGSKLAAYTSKRDSLIKEFEEQNGRKPNAEELESIRTEAAFLSRGAMDFHRGGVVAKFADGFIPYLNVAIQSSSIAARYIKNNPNQFVKKMAEAGIYIAALTVLNLMVAGDDYDNDDVQDDLLKKIVIFSPYKNEDGTRGKIEISVPMPVKAFWNIFQSMGEGIYYKTFGEGDKTPSQRKVDALNDLYDGFKQLVTSNVSGQMPPLLKSYLEYKFNLDMWRGQTLVNNIGKILPEDEGRFDEKVSVFNKAIGKATGLSPKRLQKVEENFFVPTNFITSTAYAMLDKSINAVTDVPKSQQSKYGGNNIISTFADSFVRRIYTKTDPKVTFDKNEGEVDKINQEAGSKRQEIKAEIKQMFEDKEPVSKFKEYINGLPDEYKKSAIDGYKLMSKQESVFYKNNMSEYMDIKFAQNAEAKAKVMYLYFPALRQDKELQRDIKRLGLAGDDVIRIFKKYEKEGQIK